MLVSVVMPVLDAESWLQDAIDSILAQSWRALELIVVDDGSSDRSREIAERAARGDPRVRTLFLERDPQSTTSGRAANAGIAIARGGYVARMDADDVALPDRLSRQIQFLDNRRLDACGGLAQAFGTDHRLYRYPQGAEAIERELIFRVGILHPTMIATTALMLRHPYSETVSHEDYEWQIRVTAAGARLGNLQEVVLRHRNHEDQAHVRHGERFFRDLRRYRFEHVMRLFPGTSAAEYQTLAAIAERRILHDPDELVQAGLWLVRLAGPPDHESRYFMQRRWLQLCDGAGLAADHPLRNRFPELTENGPRA
jgi:glycosyltransferase involved in cell wall biosynthesis